MIRGSASESFAPRLPSIGRAIITEEIGPPKPSGLGFMKAAVPRLGAVAGDAYTFLLSDLSVPPVSSSSPSSSVPARRGVL